MATQKFLQRHASGPGLQEASPATAGGAGNGGKLVALDETTGLIPASMMPAGIGADTVTAAASVALSAGDFVNSHDVGGVASVRKADNTDATKPAHGFVLEGAASGPVAVSIGGMNNTIPIGSFVAADLGKPVYLSTAGGITLTRPTVAGRLDQELGVLSAIGATTVTVNFYPRPGIQVA